MVYLGSVIGVILVNFWGNISIKKRLKELGYIDKEVRGEFGLKELVSLIFLFTPFVNVLMAAFMVFLTIKAMKDDDTLFDIFKGKYYSAADVKRNYERDNVKEEVLRDAFTLDGADEKLIQEEIQKIEQQKRGYEEVDSSRSSMDLKPSFSDKEYLWACAEEYAKSVVEAISLDTSLTNEQREELLNLFRKECKLELQGKDDSDKKVIKKVLNVVE